jgi:hypothetical protein
MAGKITKTYGVKKQKINGAESFRVDETVSCTCGAPNRINVIATFYKEDLAKEYVASKNGTNAQLMVGMTSKVA